MLSIDARDERIARVISFWPPRKTDRQIKYAVLFKTHFWDGFAARQVERLIAHAPGGDVFVVVNETAAPVVGIDHDEDKIVRVTEAAAIEIGLQNDGRHGMYWYSGDYHLHLMTRRFPDYDYYVVLEHDALILSNIDEIVALMAREQIDYASQPIDAPLSGWGWLFSCEGVYAFDDIKHWLICIMLFSNRAAHTLFERRVQMGQLLARGEIKIWPFSEAAVPTEMHLAGYRMAPLDRLGSIKYFDWGPPFVEDSVALMRDAVFVHPVLDTARFLANLDKWMVPPDAFFAPDNAMRQRIIGEALVSYLPRLHGRLWMAGHAELAARCVDLMRNVGDDAYLVRHGLTEDNVALGKRATQSSLSQFSVGRDEANGAITGPVSGQHRFHTTIEMRPWWMVDLLAVELVDQVRVFNRQSLAYRAVGMEMYVSRDGRTWDLLAKHSPATPFDGTPAASWVVAVGREIRFLRLELPNENVLHLDQVHVIRRAKVAAGTGKPIVTDP